MSLVYAAEGSVNINIICLYNHRAACIHDIYTYIIWYSETARAIFSQQVNVSLNKD